MNGKMIGALAGALLALVTVTANAQDMRADASGWKFDKDALAALDTRVAEEIDKGAFPGAVTMIVRKGKVEHLSAQGKLRPGGPDMTTDAIFRIYSMTKPITSVLAMMLVEEGRLDLTAPVSAYLPEFAELKVVTDTGEEAAKRPMTVHDLILHSSGLTYGFFGEGPARKALNDAGVGTEDMDNRQLARTLAELPLEHQPGTTWEYSYSTDVLGAVIEVVEGKSLGEAMKARILDPLDMKDTAFHVADEDAQKRIAEPKPDDRSLGGPVTLFDPKVKAKFESGGGGLMSTAEDYARFLQMVLNKGELDGVRILSPATIEWMGTDHLAPRGIKPGKYYLPGPGYGFGPGFAVRTAAGAPLQGRVGELTWGGAAGTYFWIDPASEMFVIYMMQSPTARLAMRPMIRTLVYGAMER